MSSNTYVNYSLMNEQATNIKSNVSNFATDFVSETRHTTMSDVISVVLASSSAFAAAYLSKSPEPFFQAGSMGVSQLLALSLGKTMRDMGNLEYKKGTIHAAAYVSLISTGLFSLINNQLHIERSWQKNITNGLISSSVGSVADNYLMHSNDCSCQY